jgi:hypothetical protein
MYKEFTKDVLKVGDKVHTRVWTDSSPGTVIEVRRNGREVVVQEDEAKVDGEELPIGHQSWEIVRNEKGPKQTYTWRTRKGNPIGYIAKGWDVCAGRGNQVHVGWHYYHDWSF